MSEAIRLQNHITDVGFVGAKISKQEVRNKINDNLYFIIITIDLIYNRKYTLRIDEFGYFEIKK